MISKKVEKREKIYFQSFLLRKMIYTECVEVVMSNVM